jgi:hypothetical protein
MTTRTHCGRWFSPASSTTKTGRHDIVEILLKVALNTINQIKSLLSSRLGQVKRCYMPPTADLSPNADLSLSYVNVFQVTIRLKPGHLIAMINRKVLHGRQELRM